MPTTEPKVTGSRVTLNTDGFHLFVEGVKNALDREEILQALPEGHPVHAALSGGGVAVLKDHQVPVPGCSLAEVQSRPGFRSATKVVKTGAMLRLPDHLACLTIAWDALERGVPYDVKATLTQYHRDLGPTLVKIVEKRVMRTLLSGVQGQASTDIRLPRGTVAMSAQTEAILLPLIQRLPEFRNVTSLDGLILLGERFPTAGPKGARWVQLVVLTDVPDLQLLFNPEDWQDLNGGDTDGDIGYSATEGEAKFGEPLHLGPYPHLVRYDQPVGGVTLLKQLASGWSPITPKQAVERVMGMCIKELTGPLDYLFHNIARSHAVREKRNERSFRKAYEAVFGIYFPIQERVMDARKLEGGLDALYRLADVVQNGLTGKAIDTQAFHPFLTSDQQVLFGEIMEGLGYTISGARSTLFGKLVAAGRGREMAIEEMIMALPAGSVLQVLQQDALGIELAAALPAGTSKKKITQKKQPPVVAYDPRVQADPNKPGDSVLALFRGLTVNGKPMFARVDYRQDDQGQRFIKNLDGSATLIGFIQPTWMEGRKESTWRVEITIPKVVPVGTEGHCQVTLPGCGTRFFRPRLTLSEGKVKKLGFGSYLKGVLLTAAQSVVARRRRDGTGVGDLLNRQIRKAVVGSGLSWRAESNPDDNPGSGLLPSTPHLDLVHRFEYEVVLPPVSTIRAGWELREQLLTLLVEQGYDILSTSKGAPGSIVTKAAGHGVPSYLMAMNPFAQYLDGKRRVEPREVRRALPLTRGEGVRVKAKGYNLPSVVENLFTHLTVAIMDLNANMFTREDGTKFCHDTLVCTSEAVEQLAVAQLEMTAIDSTQLQTILERLEALQLPGDITQVVQEESMPVGDGMTVTGWRVLLTGSILDVGKVKAAIGPIKGVMTVLPLRLWAQGKEGSRPIHMVLPMDTVKRKKALDSVLYLLAEKAGITEIDPDQDLDSLVQLIESKLSDEGLEEVMVHQDGQTYSLGKAIVGNLPFYRPPQTALSQFAVRSGSDGVIVHAHAMVMAGVSYQTPRSVQKTWDEITTIREQVGNMLASWANTPTAGPDPEPYWNPEWDLGPQPGF